MRISDGCRIRLSSAFGSNRSLMPSIVQRGNAMMQRKKGGGPKTAAQSEL
jgi:tetrahydrodipicolinate N-succinyltransferase